jgi:hypothetical protein
MEKKFTSHTFHNLMTPEIGEAFKEVMQDRREGKPKPAPRTAKECHSLEELCRYVFKLARLNGEHQTLLVDTAVKRWVWFGHTFTDRFVDRVEEAAPFLRDKESLEEFRLVATRVTTAGAARLRKLFPNSKVSEYSDCEHDKNWQLSQAGYVPV